MTNQKSSESTYDYMVDIFKESIVSNPDISGKIYKGNFSFTLEEAAKAKSKFILKRIKFRREDKKLGIWFSHIYNKIKPDEILLALLIIFFWSDTVRKRLFS